MGRGIRFAFPALLALVAATGSRAAEVIPPAPQAHFNDYAGLVTQSTAQTLDAELARFEGVTSNQVVVAIFPHMQSGSSIEDYTVRVAQAWKVGQKGRNNGAVLFVFSKDHTAFIQVGYGLEGALPDARCKEIIENDLVPNFRQGKFDDGLTASVDAILAAARGEYKAPAHLVSYHSSATYSSSGFGPFLVIGFFILLAVVSSLRRHVLYQGTGRGGFWSSAWPLLFLGGGGGRGGFGGGGGGFSGGGGGFSGGGGSFGGGGAGGSW